MSWTDFKAKYLFSINFAIMLSVILYSIRKDYVFHFLIAIWLVISLFTPKARALEKKLLGKVGHVNSTILLTSFYFLFFTPFSLVYKWFFRKESFKDGSSRLIEKNSISDFNLPF